MTKDQETNALKTLQQIEAILDPSPSPGGDVVWLLENRLKNESEAAVRLNRIADACRSDASRMGDRALKAEELLRQVKNWRDSDGNEAFPHELRKEIDARFGALSGEESAAK